MRTLNVKKTSFKELGENWKIHLPETWRYRNIYIRCNSKGEVNWLSAPVWFADDLVERGNYVIHK